MSPSELLRHSYEDLGKTGSGEQTLVCWETLEFFFKTEFIYIRRFGKDRSDV